MTGERCQSAGSATASSWRLSHTLPPSCLPSILPLPIIVNQGGVVSAGGAVRRGDCRGSGVHRGAWLCTAGPGATGGPLSRARPSKMARHLPKPFFFFCSCDVQSATGEKRRGENLDREQRLTPLRRTSSVGGCGGGAVSEMATLLPQS